MLTETLFRIPFSVIGRCSLVPTSHWLHGKMRKNLYLSQAASGMILQNHTSCQSRRFRVFEAGYWKDFHKEFQRSKLKL